MTEMRKIRWRMSIGLAGCHRDGEFNVEADLTDEEIEDIVWDEATQRLETTWEDAA